MQVNDLKASYMRDFSAKEVLNKNENKTQKQEAEKDVLNKTQDQEKTMKNEFAKLQEIGAKGLTQTYFMQFQMQTFNLSSNSFSMQSFSFEMGNNNGDFLSFLQNPAGKAKGILSGIDLSKIGYTGKPIDALSQDEAKALVGEDGFFGISKTSERIADFVIMGAGDDLEKLKSGKEGMLRGFEQAEQMWGGKLPDISYETIQKSIAKVDERISALGGNTLDVQA